MVKAKSILQSTFWVFAQRLFSALLGIVTTPMILKNLGITDFGIFTASIGLVGAINFISWSLSSATQKFFSATVNKDDGSFSHTFATSFLIYIVYGLIILTATIVLAMYGTKSVISYPIERTNTVKLVLIISGILALIQMILIPVQTVLRVHENFRSISAFGMFENVLKLLFTFVLYFLVGDKLQWYAILILMLSIITTSFQFYYVFREYKLQLNFRLVEKRNIREMLSFSGWNMLSAIAMIGRNQGIIVILNLFFGVIVSAAWGIASQLQAALNIFIQGIVVTTAPRILKNANPKQFDQMIKSANQASKFGLFVIMIVCLPLFFSLNFVLTTWLHVVPGYTVQFAEAIIVFFLVNTFSLGFQSIFQAINKVKQYNLYVSALLILNLPIGYFLFKLGYPPYSIIYCSAFLEVLSFILRLYLLKIYFSYNIICHLKRMVKEFLMPMFVITIFALLFINLFEISNLITFLNFLILNTALLSFIIYKYLLSDEEILRIKSQLTVFNTKRRNEN